MNAGCAVAVLPFRKPWDSSTTAGAAHMAVTRRPPLLCACSSCCSAGLSRSRSAPGMPPCHRPTSTCDCGPRMEVDIQRYKSGQASSHNHSRCVSNQPTATWLTGQAMQSNSLSATSLMETSATSFTPRLQSTCKWRINTITLSVDRERSIAARSWLLSPWSFGLGTQTRQAYVDLPVGCPPPMRL